MQCDPTFRAFVRYVVRCRSRSVLSSSKRAFRLPRGKGLHQVNTLTFSQHDTVASTHEAYFPRICGFIMCPHLPVSPFLLHLRSYSAPSRFLASFQHRYPQQTSSDISFSFVRSSSQPTNIPPQATSLSPNKHLLHKFSCSSIHLLSRCRRNSITSSSTSQPLLRQARSCQPTANYPSNVIPTKVVTLPNSTHSPMPKTSVWRPSSSHSHKRLRPTRPSTRTTRTTHTIPLTSTPTTTTTPLQEPPSKQNSTIPISELLAPATHLPAQAISSIAKALATGSDACSIAR